MKQQVVRYHAPDWVREPGNMAFLGFALSVLNSVFCVWLIAFNIE